jgi:hypothetical protein
MVKPFSREEVAMQGDEFPSRGIFCESCNVNIPVFEELSEKKASEIRKQANGNKLEEMRLVREATGCSVRWAKIWSLHENGPQKRGYSGNGKCPYCGGQLRTPRSKQCPECLRSWHAKSDTYT